MRIAGYLVMLFMVIMLSNGWGQQTAGESPSIPSPANKELTPEQFFEILLTALQDNDMPHIQQLVTDNPSTTGQVYQRLLRASQGDEGEDTKTYRYLAAFLEQFPIVTTLAQAGQLYQQATSLYRQGKYAEAIPLAEQVVVILKRDLGAEHPDTLTNLNNLAFLYNTMGDYAKAEPLYQRALAIREKVLGPEHPDTATSLNNLAAHYHEMGDYMKAEPLLQRALAIREKVLGPEHPDTALSLNNLAKLYEVGIGDYAKAESLYQRSLAIYEKTQGPEHPDTALSLGNLAEIYKIMGDYAKATPLFQRALAIQEKALGPEHPDTALSLGNLAEIYKTMGDYAKAAPLFQRALDIREKALGPEHPDYADSLHSLALLYQVMGDYASAKPLFQRALAIREKALGPEHPDSAASLNVLAVLYKEMGYYAKAEPLYRRAVTIFENALGPEHPHTATSLNNQALLYQNIGDYAKAELLLQRALTIDKKVLGTEHPNTAATLNNLAGLYQEKGDYSISEPLYRQALAIREKSLGPEHPDTASSLHNLAGLYDNMRDYAKAEPLYHRALAIFEKTLGTEHPNIAANLHNLSSLYKNIGDYAKAELFLQRALAIVEKVLGAEHPKTSASLHYLASLYAAQGKIEQAHALFLRAQQIDEQMIAQVLGFTSEAQQQAFLATTRSSLEMFLSLISQQWTQNPQVRKDGLDVYLRRKGVILEAQKQFQEALLLSDDPSVLKTYEELSQARMQLSHLTFAGPGKEQPEAYQQRLNALKQQKEALEAQLSRLSAAFAASRNVAKADVASVAQALPANSALVEFVQIDFFNFTAKSNEEKWQPAHYLAFVLHAGDAEHVQLIDLGETAAIDAEIAALKAELSRKDAPNFARAQRLATRVYPLVFAPLKAALGDTTTLFISPDGNLNLLPFEVLIDPDDEDERFLIEQYQFNYLAAGRDVVGFGQLAGQETPQQPLLFGAPDFGQPTPRPSQEGNHSTPANVENAETIVMTARRSADLTLSDFKPLPGAKEELETIHALLKKKPTPNPSQEGNTLVLGKDATEEALLQSRVPRFLHLATHGFFLPDQPLPEVKDGMMGLDQPARVTPTGKRFDNPLLRSGLALAGANVGLKEGTDQGLFTADKVLGLRLRGTDVVVLSACDTGLGDVQIGEGVYGLRRAFLQAGARSLVMSLWSVPDVETKELMIRFYEHLLAGKMSRAEALREAILQEKQAVEERYGLPHPAYWGAFVFLGEP